MIFFSFVPFYINSATAEESEIMIIPCDSVQEKWTESESGTESVTYSCNYTYEGMDFSKTFRYIPESVTIEPVVGCFGWTVLNQY